MGERPYGVLGTAPTFGLREETEFVSVCLRPPKKRRKRKFNVVFVQVVKKSALHVQNLLFFIYLLALFRLTFSLPSPFPSPVRRCSQDLSTVRNPNTFSVKTPAIFSLHI